MINARDDGKGKKMWSNVKNIKKRKKRKTLKWKNAESGGREKGWMRVVEIYRKAKMMSGRKTKWHENAEFRMKKSEFRENERKKKENNIKPRTRIRK